MNLKRNIARFEAEMSKVTRPGVDRLMEYVRSSDFYTAPASTKYHLCYEGGLLRHSLNVLDALRSLLTQTDDTEYRWIIAGRIAEIIPAESAIIAALFHDICKTYFYGTGTRNVKNEKTNRWEKKPYYTVDDKMPLGHGPKSAMIVKQYMELTMPEMYAIWHHMGFTGNYENDTAAGAAFEKYPLALALHTADMIASRLMEGEKGNRHLFQMPLAQAENTPASMNPEQEVPSPTSEWQEAPALQEGA